MIGRVTQSSIQTGSLQQLQARLSSQAQLQEQLASGKRVNRPSDDPAGSVDIMRIRTQQRADAQYDRNVKNAVSWLSTVDTTLVTVSSRLIEARTKVIEGNNSGAINVDQRDAIATQLESLRDALLGLANTSYNGRLVFAGTSAEEQAFVMGTDPVTGENTYTHTGFPGAAVERRVADATTIRVDSDGAAVFGSGSNSMFAILDQAAKDLRAGNDISGYIGKIDQLSSTVLQEAGRIGARVNQAKEAESAIADRKVSLATQLTSVEDKDTLTALTELSTLELAYQVALKATSHILQPSLLDHIR